MECFTLMTKISVYQTILSDLYWTSAKSRI